MKYQAEFRDPEKVKALLKKIEQTATQPWNIMEICGGQTHGLVKNGILDLLPKEITMIHGPGWVIVTFFSKNHSPVGFRLPLVQLT